MNIKKVEINELKISLSIILFRFSTQKDLIRRINQELNRRGFILTPEISMSKRFAKHFLWRYFGAMFESSKDISENSYGGEAHHFISYARKNPGATLVDIGAADGRTLSNIAMAKEMFGNPQILVESSPVTFAQLALNNYIYSDDILIRIKVNPDNIKLMVKAFELDVKPYAVSIDIDSYDYFVVDQLMSVSKPELICVEWNPIFPANEFFSVTIDFREWEGNWFFGASAAAWCELFSRHGYDAIDVCGMSIIGAPKSSAQIKLSAHEILHKYLNNPEYAETPTSKALIKGDASKVSRIIDEILSRYEGKFVYRKIEV